MENDGENIHFISLYNLYGVLLMVYEPNQSFIEIDISNLASGIYILKIISKLEYYFSTIVKI